MILYFLSPQQLLQQATSTTNQGSFNGLQRLGSEFTYVRMFLCKSLILGTMVRLILADEPFLLLIYTSLAD